MSRRLLQAIAGAPHGGAETFFVRLAGALQRAGETQRVLIRRDSERSERLRAAGVEVGELRFGGRLDMASRYGFWRAVATWRPNLVLTWMSRATLACPRGEFVHVARLGGYYDLKYYRRCDHLIANTGEIVDYVVAAGWPCERIDHLPNFVPDAGTTRLAARPAGDPLALAVGRLHPNKGFALLLEALAMTRDVRLDIAGDGPLRGDLVALAQKLGVANRVRFLGWRTDIAALLAQADVFVCPSLHEPLGNVVIEAWSSGVPVIATGSLPCVRHGTPNAATRRESTLTVKVETMATVAPALPEASIHQVPTASTTRAAAAASSTRYRRSRPRHLMHALCPMPCHSTPIGRE